MGPVPTITETGIEIHMTQSVRKHWDTTDTCTMVSVNIGLPILQSAKKHWDSATVGAEPLGCQCYNNQHRNIDQPVYHSAQKRLDVVTIAQTLGTQCHIQRKHSELQMTQQSKHTCITVRAKSIAWKGLSV